MKKLLIATLSLGALSVGAATAADISVARKAPVAVAPACAQFAGVSIGVNAGSVLHDWQWNDNNSWARNEVDLALPDSARANKFGYEVGPRIGWDWQRGCAVFGVIADWSWSGHKSTRNFSDGQPGAALDTLSVERRLQWFGTARTRAGVVFDNLLIYATGGFAYARIRNTAALTNNIGGAFVTETFTNTDWRWGGVVGVGTEWAWSGNWSIGSEFLYARFTDKNTSFSSAFATLNGNPPGKGFTNQDAILVSRFSLNYRWGAGR